MSKSKIDNALTELKRELGIRKVLYPDWVRKGQISERVATCRMEALQDAIDLLEQLKPVQPSLLEK
jgi:hypothetical protein